MKKPVTLSGRNGVDAVDVHGRRRRRCRRSRPGLRAHSSTSGAVLASAGQRRPRPAPRDRERSVLVDFSARPPGTTMTERETSISPRSRSMSDHRRAHSSPRRMPVRAPSMSSAASRGSRSSAASMTVRTTSTDGAFTRRCETRGGLACSAMFVSHPSPPDRLVQGRRDDGVVVADGLGRLSAVLHGAVEVVEVLGVSRVSGTLPRRGPDRLLDLRPVGAHGRRREVQPLALVEPPIEELAEGSARIRPSGAVAVLVDQVPECFIGRRGTAVEGLRDLARLARDRVASEVDPDLPDTFSALALRPSHRLQRSQD